MRDDYLSDALQGWFVNHRREIQGSGKAVIVDFKYNIKTYHVFLNLSRPLDAQPQPVPGNFVPDHDLVIIPKVVDFDSLLKTNLPSGGQTVVSNEVLASLREFFKCAKFEERPSSTLKEDEVSPDVERATENMKKVLNLEAESLEHKVEMSRRHGH